MDERVNFQDTYIIVDRSERSERRSTMYIMPGGTSKVNLPHFLPKGWIAAFIHHNNQSAAIILNAWRENTEAKGKKF